MSAGISRNNGPAVSNDLALLAPKFRAQVMAAIAECQKNGIDAFVFEGYRSPELQALYYARGRTIIPPTKPVTNAISNLHSWHGYGLAVDVISKQQYWNAPESWFVAVANIFKEHGCRWGGEWKMKDLPHFQWGLCKPSPSEEAQNLIKTQGMEAVWRAVQAL